MAKNSVTDWDTVAENNTDIEGILLMVVSWSSASSITSSEA